MSQPSDGGGDVDLFDLERGPAFPDELDYEEPGICECNGTGWVVYCIDDLCVGQGWCMHGDGELPCSCNPEGVR